MQRMDGRNEAGRQVSISRGSVASKRFPFLMGFLRAFPLLPVSLALVSCAALAFADDVILSDGTLIQRTVQVTKQGTVSLGDRATDIVDVVAVCFARGALPERVPSAVLLAGGSMLSGEVQSVKSGNVQIASSTLGQIELSKDFVAALYLTPVRPDDIKAAATDMSESGPTGAGREDRIFTVNGDNVSGAILRMEEEVVYRGKEGARHIPRNIVTHVYCRLPDAPKQGTPPKDGKAPVRKAGPPKAAVRLKNGDVLRGEVLQLDAKEMLIGTDFASKVKVPRGLLLSLYVDGGRAEFLSAKTPVEVKETPQFDSVFHHRRDLSVGGGMMRVGDSIFETGLGVHSRCELTYELGGSYRRLIAVCGVDASVGGRGELEFVVLADGKAVYQSGVMTGKDPAKLVSAPLSGARKVTLKVDFGPRDDDSGDHADWGWAAVVRE